MFTIENLRNLRASQLMTGFAGIDGFTPIDFVINQVEKVPIDYSNPNLKFFFPAAGHGTYAIVIFWKLFYGLSEIFIEEEKRSRHILKNMLYLNEINSWHNRQLFKQGFLNVYHGDLLKYETDMKFDVIVGNPPFQEKVGNRKTEPLWNKFVLKVFDMVKDGGYVSLVHPSGWRSSKGKFKKIQKLILNENLLYLSMNDFNEGFKVFGVGTNFDYYVVQKSEDYNQTIISDVDGNQTITNLKGMEFIPNGLFEKFNNIIAKDGEEKVNVLYSRSQYGTDKSNMSRILTGNNIYPCVYTITQKDGINLFYSDVRGDIHFDVPKVIWSNGLGTYPIVDSEGTYGLTQFSYGIVDSVENLENIKIAMESEEFIELMSYVKYTNNKYDYKIISTFKKDFWREFIHE